MNVLKQTYGASVVLFKGDCKALRTVRKVRSIRNPVVGKANERFYCIDAAAMRVIQKLARSV